MNAERIAVDLADEIALARAWEATVAAGDPAGARRHERECAKRGTVPTHVDPVLQVRCSQLEALCCAVLGTEPATTDPHPTLF